MSGTQNSDDDPLSIEAARWLLALEEDPDDAALHAAFNDWLMRSPENERAWEETMAVSGLMAALPLKGGEEPTLAAPRGRPVATCSRFGQTGATALRRRPARRHLLIMPLLFAALTIAVLPLRTWIEADHVTLAGEVRQIVLRDGSTLHLGPDSAVSVTFGPRDRHVALMRGEVYLRVSHETERPFRLTTHRLEARVLGTAFHVRIGEQETTVAVREGRVSVTMDDLGEESADPLTLGERMRVGEQSIERGSVPPEEIDAWLEGRLVVRDRPVREVIAILRRYHRGALLLVDTAVIEKRVTGVYDLHDPISALRAIAAVHGSIVREVSPWFVVVSPF
ncbi:MAG: FecR domain-containing protein [Pseudomonadota bacterium]